MWVCVCVWWTDEVMMLATEAPHLLTSVLAKPSSCSVRSPPAVSSCEWLNRLFFLDSVCSVGPFSICSQKIKYLRCGSRPTHCNFRVRSDHFCEICAPTRRLLRNEEIGSNFTHFYPVLSELSRMLTLSSLIHSPIFCQGLEDQFIKWLQNPWPGLVCCIYVCIPLSKRPCEQCCSEIWIDTGLL